MPSSVRRSPATVGTEPPPAIATVDAILCAVLSYFLNPQRPAKRPPSRRHAACARRAAGIITAAGQRELPAHRLATHTCGLFVWLVADGWCWFVLREKYCWLVAGDWFVLREKYCWLVADKPSEQAVGTGACPVELRVTGGSGAGRGGGDDDGVSEHVRGVPVGPVLSRQRVLVPNSQYTEAGALWRGKIVGPTC
jgi:hypothetical protein